MPVRVDSGVATAVGFGGKPASRQAKILGVQAFRNPSGSMRAFFSAELPSGLRLHGLKLMIGPAGKFWIGTPDKQQRDREDNIIRGPDGKPRWAPMIEFRDRPTRDRFNELILTALREANPELFGEGPT